MSNPYAQKLKKVVFDIETMGLAPVRDMVICASFCDPDTLEVEQIFAEKPENEEQVLKDIMAKLNEYEVVITYNGDSFDIPFVKTRAQKHGLDFYPLFWSIDMYRYLKKYWPLADRLPHLNQKSVENTLGLSDDRDDKIDGGECIPLYTDYVRTGNTTSKDLILLHNADDVRQLAKIYNAANFLEFDRIAFEKGFGIAASRFVLIDSIRIDKNNILIKAKTRPGGIPASIYEDGLELEYDCILGLINLKLYLQTKGKTRYVDLLKIFSDDSDFKDLSGYHSGFLVIVDNDKIMYRELNTLVEKVLSKEGYF